MNRPVVVIDTNVFVSAASKLSSNEASVVLLIVEQKAQLVVSPSTLEEYHDVLFRPRLKLDSQRVTFLLNVINRQATLIRPASPLWVSPQEPDNRFLECAEAAEADYSVTGNKRHFPNEWKSTKIVNARELLDRLPQP